MSSYWFMGILWFRLYGQLNVFIEICRMRAVLLYESFVETILMRETYQYDFS